MEFRKSLAKYYHTWLKNARESVEYCERRGDKELAEQYHKNAEEYEKLIQENEKAIEFFSIGDRAFLYDEVLPVEFRGYK